VGGHQAACTKEVCGLLRLVRYVAERDSSAAVQLGRTIEDSSDWPLPEHPLPAPSWPDAGHARDRAHPNHIVVYRVERVCMGCCAYCTPASSTRLAAALITAAQP
jgi:hypothetical protein